MMTKLNQLEALVQSQGDKIVAKAAEIDALKDQLREANEELQHYRRAVAAVKWLWDRAQEQKPFQL